MLRAKALAHEHLDRTRLTPFRTVTRATSAHWLQHAPSLSTPKPAFAASRAFV
jgi:hypothetical protein